MPHEDSDASIRVLRPFFLDYLQGKLASGYKVLGDEKHTLMFRGSLAAMYRGLKFNICELEDSYQKKTKTYSISPP